jgi:hypothetical protein
MNALTAVLGFGLLASPAADADMLAFRCANADGQNFAFSLSPDRHVITFDDITYFGAAQILADAPFGVTIEDGGKLLRFTYDWYYEAEYELRLQRPYWETGRTGLSLSFDDSDGAFVDDEPFSCSVSARSR